jgi:hypothetical protein
MSPFDREVPRRCDQRCSSHSVPCSRSTCDFVQFNLRVQDTL